MTLARGSDGSAPAEPVGGRSGIEERRKVPRSTLLATGTLACPACDAPVVPRGRLAPTDALACPFCARTGAVREFLSLSSPTRPARVEVRVGSGRSPATPRR